MMQAIKMKQGIYWVGAIDWALRNFHGYETSRGSTYNAYLIIDEKITLIDTVKEGFTDELMQRISSIIDPSKIDYVISSHLERDHSGAIPAVMKYCPNATVVTSLPHGLKGLKSYYGEYKYQGVKAGDTINIGTRNLQFVTTPMLHWPDSMITYCPEEKILFSNDAFGQHYATSGRFDDECPISQMMEEAKKYYANILMLYGRQAEIAYKTVASLDVEIIATGHGVSWRSHVKEILDGYKQWSTVVPETGAVVVFDSMWHSTEIMATAIAEAFIVKGIETKLYDLKVNHISDIVTEVLTSKYIAVGSPTLNNMMMPTVAEFLCYLRGLSPKNRQAFAFGSYGWGGQSIAQVEDELKKCGFTICLDKIRLENIPNQTQLAEITQKIIDL